MLESYSEGGPPQHIENKRKKKQGKCEYFLARMGAIFEHVSRLRRGQVGRRSESLHSLAERFLSHYVYLYLL